MYKWDGCGASSIHQGYVSTNSCWILRTLFVLKIAYSCNAKGRGGAAVRTSDSQWREPGFESSCCRFETLAISLTPRCHSSLSCHVLGLKTVREPCNPEQNRTAQTRNMYMPFVFQSSVAVHQAMKYTYIKRPLSEICQHQEYLLFDRSQFFKRCYVRMIHSRMTYFIPTFSV